MSRWASVTEFVGKYQGLQLGNGGSWCRNNSSLAKEFKLEFDKGQTLGNSIDRIRLNGYKTRCVFNQSIRQDIKNYYKQQCCAMCGACGNSENTQIEVDHKDGHKNDLRVSDSNTQTFDDFQALCKLVMTRNVRFVKNAKKVAIDLMQQRFLAIIILSMRGRLNMMVVWAVINMTPYNTGKLVMIGYTMKGIKKAMVMGIKLDTIKRLLYSGCNELHRF